MTYRLPVLITIDTELWPHSPCWRAEGLAADFERDILGRTEHGDFGIDYQMDVFGRHGLRAVFLVEGLFAEVVGLAHLRNIIQAIDARGHEVQLHVHPEWLQHAPALGIPWDGRKYLHQYSLDDQVALLRRSLANLVEAGARHPSAFRAGNYGANMDTLRALSRLGIGFDTSLNRAYADEACRLAAEVTLHGPSCLEGVVEHPISYVLAFGRQVRHAQLVAASFGELAALIEAAWKRRWQSVVIVSHSFEMLDRRGSQWQSRGPDPVIVRRFEKLCAWLATNRDRFVTMGFQDLPPLRVEPGATAQSSVVHAPLRHSLVRVTEQAVRRLRP